MSTHKSIDRVCVVIIVLCLLMTILFMNGQALGLQSAARSMGYEETLFDTSRVHTIDILINDWDAFIETCESETYSTCSVVIDNEAVKNVAIRGKGNTSLSSVRSMGSQRYSFKIEFDQYEDGKNYHGLDKLSLNNIIQDNTYMKDYLAYRLMDEFGVDSPLCSFVYVTVNGEDWGLYLAVEGVEDSFLQRNYGRDTGELYKPDSMSFGGGGPGNGKGFNMDDFLNRDTEGEDTEEGSGSSGFPGVGGKGMPEGFDPSQFGGSMPEGFDPSQFGGSMPEGFDPSQFGGSMPEGFDPSQFGGDMPEGFDPTQSADGDEQTGSGESGRSRRSGFGGGGFDFGGIFGGMGSGDVKLQYTDDDPDSYSNIFNNAKTDVSKADQKRLIEALKKLNAYEDLEDVLDVDEVIRYFVVHNYVCNGDSYTGSIIHNYYLHESDGKISMIPWDYNLAFGTFRSSDATEVVNDPIDTPMEVSDASDRPMWGWIMNSEEYTALYHQYFAEFLDTVDITGVIDEAYALIKSYVEKDPTAFCTYEEFETGVAALRTFCELRTESVRGQLEGTIPSTSAGQRADDSALVDASGITISAMGSMGGGGGPGGGGGDFGGTFPGQSGGSGSEMTPPDDGSGRPSMGSEGFPSGSFGGFGSGEGSGDGSGFSGSFPGQDGGSGSFPGGGPGSGMTPPDDSSGQPSMGSGGFPGGSFGSFGSFGNGDGSGDGSGFGSFSGQGGGPGGFPGGDGNFSGLPGGNADGAGSDDGSSIASGDSGSAGSGENAGSGSGSGNTVIPREGNGSFRPPGDGAGFPGRSGSAGSGTAWLLLGISVLVLLAGLFIALKFKRQG